MATYLSPGVYVKEIASGSAPIAGVGTSTAAFIGVIPKSIAIPTAPIIETQEKFVLEVERKQENVKLTAQEGQQNKQYTFILEPEIKEEVKFLDMTIELVNAQQPSQKFSLLTGDFTIEKKGKHCTIRFKTEQTINPQTQVTITYKYRIQEECEWKNYPGNDLLLDWEVWVGQTQLKKDDQVQLLPNEDPCKIKFTNAPEQDFTIKYKVKANQITNEIVGKLETTIDDSQEFQLNKYPVITSEGTYKIKIDGTEITGVPVTNDKSKHVAKFTLNAGELTIVENGKSKTITADYQVRFPNFETSVADGEVKLCTNFNEFKKFFGDFSSNTQQNALAHAVYGFFNNGGTRCYVMRVEKAEDITVDKLEKLEAIDEIAIVAAPGITNAAARSAIITHCQQTTGDRFAILDCNEKDTVSDINKNKPDNSNYAAFYFPWIQVFDPATKTMNPQGEGLIYVPPSGHIAGIYARVDSERGVHKAPANETVLGALGLKQNISKNQQDGLNPQGINCIRELNGNIRLWGARTIGGDANGEFKYINARRLFNYLKKSIDEGTQWTVFEPNSPELWAKIRRNLTAFLITVWRSGALFGNTPEQAFYVKCDEETNPPEVRDQGQVVTEIGVAIVKPAEFVIFHLSQWAGPGK